MFINENLINKRILWIDWVKCIAILAVLFIHTSSSYMVDLPVGSINWNIALFFESISRFGIILFIMSSGYLLLRKDYNLKEFLVKRFSRVLIPFFFWNLICIIVKLAFNDPLKDYNILSILSYIVRGFLDPTIVTVQFWFIYMILGLYLVTPILIKWIRKATDTEIIYLLIICFSFLIINFLKIPFLMSDYINLFTGFIGYFVLGYFLAIKKEEYAFLNTKFGIISFLIGFIGIFIGTFILSSISGQFEGMFMPLGDLTPFAALEAIGMYILIMNYTPKIKNKLLNFTAIKISIASFGIYLVNVLVINILKKIGILSSNKFALFIIIGVIIVMIISYIILYIMNKLPILNKFSTINH